LSYAYDPAAVAPNWLFLLERFERETVEFLQEFAGYALTPDTKHELALWLKGQPGGGKSTVLAGFQAMLGPKAGLLGLADIERNRFALASLPGKTLVVSTEQPGDFLSSTHVVNAIISGEPVMVDRKFKEAIAIEPRAKIAWAMNDYPRVGSATDGIFRRVKVVDVPVIPEDERRPELKIAIQQEAAGILNWAIAGLRRLQLRGRFVIPEAMKIATQRFVAQNDIAAAFVDDCCLTGEACKVQSRVLYTAYKEWATETAHKPKSETSMAEEWRRLGFEGYSADGRNYWRGVKLLGRGTTGG